MKIRTKITAALTKLALLTLLGGCASQNEATANTVSQAETSAAKETAAEETAAPESAAEDSKADAPAAQLGAPEKTDINLGYLNSTAHLLAFVAQEEGYFAEVFPQSSSSYRPPYSPVWSPINSIWHSSAPCLR